MLRTASTAADWPQSPRWFAEYFPRYMAAHSKPGTRWLHVAGTLCGASLVGTAVMRRRPAYAAAGPLVLFTLAWIGHFGVERNKPAGFQNPIRAIPGDLTLTALMLAGQQRRLDRLNSNGLRNQPDRSWQSVPVIRI